MPRNVLKYVESQNNWFMQLRFSKAHHVLIACSSAAIVLALCGAGGFFPEEGEVSVTTVSRKKIYCAFKRDVDRWKLGKYKSSRSEEFLTIETLISNARQKIKKAKTEAKRTKATNALASLQSYKRIGNPVCKVLPDPDSSSSSTSSSSSSGPTPTPTITPTPGSVCFDAQGNTTCFGIPNGFSGNYTTGISTYPNRGCNGCHSAGSKAGFCYQKIFNAFDIIPQMENVTRPSTQDLADITAYLNGPSGVTCIP